MGHGRTDLDLGVLLRQRGGVLRSRDLIAAGFSGDQVAALTHNGLLVRTRVGWYCSPHLEEPSVRALRVGGVLGCVSAAASWGMATPEHHDETLHVSLLRNASRLRDSRTGAALPPTAQEVGVRLHWEGRYREAFAYRVAPLDVLVQMAACVTPFWLTAALDSALHEPRDGRAPLLTVPERAQLRRVVPGHLVAAVDAADGSAESVGETRARIGLVAARIAFEPQALVGGRFQADFLIDGWLVLEVDGREYHSAQDAFVADRERDAFMAWLGYRVLRFTHHQVMHEWPWVLEVLRQVVATGRPTAS
jgi:very-short-patch-repair endonuclease